LYDSGKNDILLQTCYPIDMWESEGVLNIRAVIKIWFYLNFDLSFAKDMSKNYELIKSKLQSCIECSLNKYQQVKYKTIINSSDYSYKKIIRPSSECRKWQK